MITLYTQPGCPACEMLKRKMNEKHIAYEVVSDRDELIRLGIKAVPALRANNESLLSAKEALQLIDEMKEVKPYYDCN